MSRLRSEGLSSAERGKRAQTPPPRPAPPGSTAKSLTDADHFGMIRTFSVASLRRRSASLGIVIAIKSKSVIGFAGIRNGAHVLQFKDYASRLNLDHVLFKMRMEFELHKERTRDYLKERYKVALPVAEGLLIL
jgi:hypothetical protein